MSAPDASPAAVPSTDRWLERLSLAHALLLVFAASWGYGGMIHWIRGPLALGAALAGLLTVAALVQRGQNPARDRRLLLGLLPLLGLALLVALGSLNPSYRLVPFFEGLVYRPTPPAQDTLPSSARPDLAARELLLLGGLYLTGLNLALNVRRRRVLRLLLLVLVVNAVALAVFGSLQKLLGAPGLYFGAQPSPNPAFFATFIYHNHWGAFVVLHLVAALVLSRHFASLSARGFWHSPAPLLLGGALLLTVGVALSTSRSALLLTLLVLAGAGAGAIRSARAVTAGSGFPAARFALVALALALLAVATGWVAGPVLHTRWQKTVEQVQARESSLDFGGRTLLYRDTWRMFQDRPWTGWGLESFETVFVRYNSHTSPHDHLVRRFDQAHSDWLQALAELGVIGTGLLALLGLLPLWATRRELRAGGAEGPALLAGCALLALYALVEFPFANPAVVATFWILFFGGIRISILTAR